MLLVYSIFSSVFLHSTVYILNINAGTLAANILQTYIDFSIMNEIFYVF